MYDERRLVLLKFSTTYHLLNGLAYIEFLSRSGIRSTLIACYDDYWRKNNIDKYYLDFLAKCGAVIVCKERFGEMERELKGAGKKYTKITINDGFQLPFSIKEVISIDDGIGAYQDSVAKLKSLVKEVKLINCSYVESVKLGFALLVKRLLSAVFPARRFGLFATLTPLAEDRDYVECVKEVLDKLSKGREEVSSRYLGAERVILFLTQPAVQLKWVTEEKYRAIIERLRFWAEAEMKAILVAKKHPVDEFDYGSLPVVDFGGMAEELITDKEVVAVVSINSTSLIMAGAVFDKPAYTIHVNDYVVKSEIVGRIFKKYSKVIGGSEY